MDLRRRHCSVLIALIAVVVVADVISAVNCNVVFEVRHKYGGRGKGKAPIALLRKHDSNRHGRMLSAIDFELGGDGSPTNAALYYTRVRIGSPPFDYHVQVDTGSDIMWVNCQGCVKCPTKSDLDIPLKQYDMSASSTGNIVACDQPFCETVFNSVSPSCKAGMSCDYAVTYGDGSRTEGYFVRDYFTFDRVSGNLQTATMNGSIAFGCSSRQSGELGSSSEAVDGIIGFGQANTSVLSQLAQSSKVKKVFSHCLDGNKGGGIFAIGEVVDPKVNSTPIVPNTQHYNVVMRSIDVGGQSLDIPSSTSDGGSIIDSGTTLAYLPSDVYKQVLEKIMTQQPGLKTHIVEQQFTCFWYRGNVDHGFPVVNFHFDGSLSLPVYPHDYLFEVRDGEYCIGWQNSGMQTKDGQEITLLGDLALSDKLVVYDLENQTIGWVQYNCSSSIKVRDDATGNAYSVEAHNISRASSTSNLKLFTLFMATLLLGLIL